MIIQKNEKIHVVYRALYEGSTRRHVIGEVTEAEGSVCRIYGYVFIYDTNATEFVRKQNKRTTVIDLAESGYIVNIVPNDVDLDGVIYRYLGGEGAVLTDGKNFQLNINEFTSRS